MGENIACASEDVGLPFCRGSKLPREWGSPSRGAARFKLYEVESRPGLKVVESTYAFVSTKS